MKRHADTPRRLRASIAATVTTATAIALAACSTPPSGDVPALDVPASWRNAPNATDGQTPADPTSPAAAIAPDWWRAFGSVELSELVAQAQANSFDVAAAAARVRQAQAQARIAGAALLPDVSLAANVQRFKEPQETVSGFYNLQLFASYEVDIWGGNAALRDSARAALLSTAYARDAITLTVVATVANTYLQTVALRERVTIAQRNLDNSERILALVSSRARAGAATPLEVAQQRGLVATQRQELALRTQQSRASLATLATVLGRPTEGFDIAATTLAGIAAPTAATGVPSELLARRPDLAQAERALAAADANITVARAAMLPTLTLTAGAGAGAEHVRNLFDTSLYNLAAGLVVPIFNAGRLSAGRDLAVARREELLAAYRGAIVNAFGDVETALAAADGVAAQRAAQDEALAQASEAVRLAESRYRAGAETLLTLLDAQRTLYAAQDQQIQLNLSQRQSSVALYRALGGGWRTTPSENTPIATDSTRCGLCKS
ncbi:efflux transporter outer membrane subunit [Cupriavidus plantarum]|uniref:efflux transporter outer membrane subunit n=2 Tax=Cupriavidus plantarum TaxID=942865 RepID=UPI00339D3D92